MNSAKASQLLSQIDSTLVDIGNVSGSSHTVDSFLAQFLVVYVCGIYEEIVEAILIDFVTRHSSQTEIVAYMRKSMDQTFRNPDSARIISLMDALGNSAWAGAIKRMANERIALDSIVNNKNDIAHGRGSTITLTDVIQYYKLSRPLIEQIDSLLV